MESSGNFPMDGTVEVDETYVGGQDNEALGLFGNLMIE
jgi:hypothetical protein